MADITLKIYGDATQANQVIQQLEGNLKRIQGTSGKLKITVDQRAAEESFKGLDQAFGKWINNFQSTMRSRISTAIIGAVTKSTKEALNTMREVDQQLTNIQKVSGKTAAEIQKIGDSAYKTASKFGVAAEEYLEAVYTFQKAGLNDSAEQMAELATKTMLVGDTTATVASKFLIATNAAWNLEGNIERLSEVVDEADYINNNYATDLAKLSAGMPIVASTAANMNMTIEETLAVLGTITAKTQETGTKAATAWRALSMNLAKEVGTITDEEGEAIEVTEESIKSVTDALKLYGGASIQAAIDSGKVIKPIEAVKALADAYKDGLLDDIELTNILMNVGGKLRTNQLTALVKDLASETSTYYDIMDNLPNAVGTADSEINTMLGSWNSKTQILKNTWTEFISHLVDSDTIKSGIEVITTLVNGLDTDFGKLIVTVTALSAALIAFGPTGTAVAALAAGFLYARGESEKSKKAYEEATKALRNLEETMERAPQSFEKTKKETEATANVAEAYIQRLEELDKVTNKTADQQEEYHRALQGLVNLIPDLNGIIDLEKDYINGGTDALRKNTEAWVKNAEARAWAAASDEILTAYNAAKVELSVNQQKQYEAEKALGAAAEEAAPKLDALNEKYAYQIEMAKSLGGIWWNSDEFERYLSEKTDIENETGVTAAKEAKAIADKAVEEAEEALKKTEEEKRVLDEAYGTAVLEWEKEKAAKEKERTEVQKAFDSFFSKGSKKAGDAATTAAEKTQEAADAAKELEENMAGAAAEAEDYSNIIGGGGAVGLPRPASDDKSQRVKPDDLGESAAQTEENAARITQAVGAIPPAYDTAQKEIDAAQDQMVSDAEAFVEDTSSAIAREASTAAGAAASAGTTIGLSFAKAIDQSDAVITGIANMVGAAKQFMASLGGSFSIHPSGANYYLERGTGKQIFYNQQAGGTTNAPGGPTLVNELGPELINDNGRVYIANGGRPAVVNLGRGAIVLTAEQTAGALKGSNAVPKHGAAYAYSSPGGGATSSSIKKGNTFAKIVSSINGTLSSINAFDTQEAAKAIQNVAGKIFGGSSGGGSSGGGKSAAQIAKEAAEKRKKELEAAQKKLDDSLSNLDKQIKLALNQGDEKKAAQLYEKQQQLIADMVKTYQKAGYKDTSNEILDLLNKNYDIAAKQEDLYKDKFDDLIDSLDANTDAEKKANTLAEKQQAVADAQEALANAQKQRTVRIYNAATGQWEWIADEKQVKSAEENLKKAEESYADEVKSQALEELKAMRDTISNLNDIVLGPALSTVATMGSDTSEFQAFAQALHAVYGVGSYLVGTEGSSKVLPTNDSHDTVYSFGDLVLTEEQASTMTLKQLAQQLQVLKLTS